jgi:hypothetical protein
MKIENRSTPEQIATHVSYLRTKALEGQTWALEELSGLAYDNPEAQQAIRETEASTIPLQQTIQKSDVPDSLFSTMIHVGEVPQSAWSIQDQKRLAQGQPPQGHPEHPNV